MGDKTTACYVSVPISSLGSSACAINPRTSNAYGNTPFVCNNYVRPDMAVSLLWQRNPPEDSKNLIINAKALQQEIVCICECEAAVAVRVRC